jgi:predicted AlkP superfamily pyrophosphatase or phosphodiesterase
MLRGLSASLLLASFLAAAPFAETRPKLVVVIAVDQFSTELMQTYGPELTGGLAQLRREGVFFTEAYHDHAFTETGPGHSVLLSGRFPASTGIVENRWLDRASGKFVYCVEDAAAKSLTPPGLAGSSNARFLGEVLGDWLQAQVPGSRVFAVSGKDRAAILMAGRRPTGTFWFTGPAGFTSSTAYAPRLPDWLVRYDQGFSSRLAADSWLWSQDPATPAGRSAQWTLGATTVRNGGLPRLIQGAGMPLDKNFEARFRKSPFLDAVTLEAAEALLEGEKLGRGPGTDLLAVSFSATDYIGHNYGTLGTEMRDQIHRLDQLLGRLLDRLRHQYPGAWVVLSADHGGLDIPEALIDQGFPAHRLLPEPFMAALQADLRATFKVDRALLLPTTEPNALYLDELAVKASGLDRRDVLKRIQTWLRARPEVAEACTAEELAAVDPAASGSPRDSSLRVLLRRSFRRERSGDILVAVKPLVVIGNPPTGYPATHGTPNAYDRRVPLIFWGPWRGGERHEPVRIVDLAPTLAKELGLRSGTVDGSALDLGPRK